MLLVDADPALTSLLEEWLIAEGCVVVPQSAAGTEPEEPVEPFDLVVVDVAFPRQGGVDLIERLAQRHPSTPMLALSSTFFAGIDCCGPVAQALGVACVLAKPVSHQSLIDAVRRLLRP